MLKSGRGRPGGGTVNMGGGWLKFGSECVEVFKLAGTGIGRIGRLFDDLTWGLNKLLTSTWPSSMISCFILQEEEVGLGDARLQLASS